MLIFIRKKRILLNSSAACIAVGDKSIPRASYPRREAIVITSYPYTYISDIKIYAVRSEVTLPQPGTRAAPFEGKFNSGEVKASTNGVSVLPRSQGVRLPCL